MLALKPSYRDTEQVKFWTGAEIKFLRDNYMNLGSVQCAQILSRSPGSVRAQAARYNIANKKPPRNKQSTQETDTSVRQLDLEDAKAIYGSNDDINTLANRYGLSKRAVRLIRRPETWGELENVLALLARKKRGSTQNP